MSADSLSHNLLNNMNVLKSKITKKLGGIFSLLLLIALCSTKANAADFGEMTLGQEYSYNMFEAFSGHFTAPKSGKLYIAGPMMAGLYTDAACTQPAPGHDFVGYGPYTVSYTVTEGNVYYLSDSGEFDAGKVKITMDGIGQDPLQLVISFPAENSYYDLATDASITLLLQFNHVMTCNSSWFLKYQAPDGSMKVATYSGVQVNSKFVEIPLQAKLKSLMRDGQMKPDSEFEVMLDGLQSESGLKLEDHLNDAGYTVFKYKVGNLPAVMVSEVVPTSFLSYWIPGSPSAKFEVTFDQEIMNSSNTYLFVQYGEVEVPDGYYQESVPFKVEGNKITADFSGVLRTPSTMLPLKGTKMSKIGVRLQSVLDSHGTPVASPGAGTVGSFDWYLDYHLLDRANVACEFYPANGGSILNKTEIELWLNGLNTLKFDGFLFECDGVASVVVPIADAEFEKGDTSDEGVYIFPIPTSMRGKKGVRVSLANLVAADGYDHSNDVKAVYDSFTVTYCNPANGAQMEWLRDGEIIKIESNSATANPDMCVVYEIEDLNPTDPEEAIIKSMSYMQRQSDGSYTSEVFGDYKLILGHKYKVTFTAWASESDKNYGEESLGSDYVIWEGLTLPFQYSDVELESITPAEGTKLTKEDRVFTLKFNGYVTLDASTTFINIGQGMTQPFESIVGVESITSDSGVEFANEWVLTVPESYMASLTSALDISFKPMDQEGLLLLGNMGKEEQTYFYYSYDTANRYAPVNVYLPADDPEPTSVKVIWVNNDLGVLPSYTMAANEAYVVNKSRDVVARVAEFIIPINDIPVEEVGDRINTEVGLVLDTEIDAPGAYYLVAPANYFSIGTEYNPYCSEEIFWSFDVYRAQTGELPHTMDIVPAPGQVETLSTVEIVFTDEDEISIGSGMITLHIDEVEHSKHDAELDWDIWNKAIVDLGTSHSAEGTYKLSFPAGYFVLGSMGDRESEAFNLEYKVNTNGIESITITTASGKVYDLNGTLRQDTELPAGIYIIDGKKVMVK